MTRKLPKFKRIKDMTPDEKKVLSQRIQLYGGVALIFILCALFLRFYNTRLIESSGILPTPRQVVEPIAVTYRAQDDPAWAQEVLGDTGYTMAQEGSLFCSLSMALETCGVDADPGALNRAFVDNDMYVNGNAADLTRLSELYPQIVFSAPRDFDGEDITQSIADGRASASWAPRARTSSCWTPRLETARPAAWRTLATSLPWRSLTQISAKNDRF